MSFSLPVLPRCLDSSRSQAAMIKDRVPELREPGGIAGASSFRFCTTLAVDEGNLNAILSYLFQEERKMVDLISPFLIGSHVSR